ncbi:FAD-binding oxidoreductase [Streptomyces sp. NPDC005408]|uniref:NAD(P)/FAD-dependent oxidoreductase n=1 Tax=Streptomyces sp. NPDC005408 TaxID=3155341 RepID=UPI0033B7B89E
MTHAVESADVAIVGGGIMGLATAERLGAHGLSVIVVDESGIAGGASGASGGLVRALDMNGRQAAWAAEGLDRYLRRGWRGTWPQVHEQGSLTLVDADGFDRAVAAVAAVRAAGQRAGILPAEEIRATFAGLSVPDGFVGVFEPGAGWLPAKDVAAAMLSDAGPRVQVRRARATRLLTSDAGVSGVETTTGRVRARAVLLTAGVGSVPLAESLGVQLPLRTRAVSYCLFEPAAGTDVSGLPTVVDFATGAWLRRWNSGATLLAGVASKETDVPATVRAGVPPAEERRVRDVVRHRYPPLAGARLVGGVSAYDAMAAGGEGAVTVWPQVPGLVTATGWNGGGFKLAPAVGDHAAARLREAIG